jgi:outer membrane receptor protein involved in Fe transport
MGVTVDGNDGWFGALRWRYFGPRPLIEDNSVRSASTALLNARVGYNVSKTVKLQLDGYNLLNRQNNDIDYYYPSRLTGEAAPQADVHFHPVEKRSLRLSMIVSY